MQFGSAMEPVHRTDLTEDTRIFFDRTARLDRLKDWVNLVDFSKWLDRYPGVIAWISEWSVVLMGSANHLDVMDEGDAMCWSDCAVEDFDRSIGDQTVSYSLC